MGNEHTKIKKITNESTIQDEAVKAQAGFANIYTPTQRYVDMVAGAKSFSRKERKEEIKNFIMNSPGGSRTKRLATYLKLFLFGGFVATAADGFKAIYGGIQYFPFNKVEEFVGERRRLSLYPLK